MINKEDMILVSYDRIRTPAFQILIGFQESLEYEWNCRNKFILKKENCEN